jgi:hypothetical protein
MKGVAIGIWVAIFAFAFGWCIGEARGQEFPMPPMTDHVWIQKNKDYTLKLPSSSTHCCAQDHCRMLHPGQVERVEDGYLIYPSPPMIKGVQFFPESEVYYTEADGEGEYWACALGGKVRCLFVPPLGF